jgi:hypothetical protein
MTSYSPESLRLARRLAYEDGLVLLGVPAMEAARRAAERYPRVEPSLGAPEARAASPQPPRSCES